jgi:hypothetical protein
LFGHRASYARVFCHAQRGLSSTIFIDRAAQKICQQELLIIL